MLNNIKDVSLASIGLLALIQISLPAAAADDEPQRTLIGYSSELSVRPGETAEFMVNSEKSEPYEADLVRVINGESQTI